MVWWQLGNAPRCAAAAAAASSRQQQERSCNQAAASESTQLELALWGCFQEEETAHCCYALCVHAMHLPIHSTSGASLIPSVPPACFSNTRNSSLFSNNQQHVYTNMMSSPQASASSSCGRCSTTCCPWRPAARAASTASCGRHTSRQTRCGATAHMLIMCLCFLPSGLCYCIVGRTSTGMLGSCCCSLPPALCRSWWMA